ncbi:MAG TPA: hypothetical protein VGO40_00670 [Longimicrobium sp.]|nr:hypothetical protein [Longimicrobium sp.]
MANVNFQLLGSGNVNPGASTSFVWKNAPSKHVWAFSVEAKDVTGDDFLLGPVAFEITRVVYHLITPGNRRIEVVIKNSGSVASGYNLYSAMIGA